MAHSMESDSVCLAPRRRQHRSRAHPRAEKKKKVASALDDLAGALLFWREDDFSDGKASDQLPEAEALATRSLRISRQVLGADHPMTAGREHNLGMVKRSLGLHDAAR